MKYRATAKITARPPAAPLVTENPFAFVHINKCGGSSVEIALGLPKSHETAAEMRHRMGPQKWSRTFTFAIVRNPFARVVSIYYNRVKGGQGPVSRRLLNVNQWIERIWLDHDEDLALDQRMVAPASDWITQDGRIIVDSVARLEALDQDWPIICEGLGTNVTLSRSNTNMYPPYRALMTNRARAIVQEAFAEDFERFGYTF